MDRGGREEGAEASDQGIGRPVQFRPSPGQLSSDWDGEVTPALGGFLLVQR
jgi:hypothetical protein